MKFQKGDFRKLRSALVVMIFLTGAAVVMAWWSNSQEQQATEARNHALLSKNQAEQKLLQVRTEEQELKTRAVTFQKLQNDGITGDEKRLDWMEMLTTAQREMRLPGMNYEFGAQIALETVNGAGYAFFASPMRLRLRLLHEGDLLNFLARIQKEASAMVLVRGCKLYPTTKSSPDGELPAQLDAECELQWITIKRSTGKN